MADNGYQSGGRNIGNRGYSSPNRAIDTTVNRMLMEEVDNDHTKIKDLSTEEVELKLQHFAEKLTEFADLTSEETTKIIEYISSSAREAKSAGEAFKMAHQRASKITTNSVPVMKSMQKQRGSDPNNKGIVGKINNNPMLQSVHIQQQILNRLTEMNNHLGGITDIVVDTNNDINQGQNEEEGLFDTLRQTIIHSVLNGPMAGKLSKLGSSLISAGLFKVASNEKMPSVVRQAAMGAVYLQVPETIMGAVGGVLNTVLSSWLSGSVSKILSGSLSNLGPIIGNIIGKVIPWALIGAGILMAVKGTIDHHKNMKAKDAEIARDMNMTQAQKDKARLKEHAKSGAKVGQVSGALIGAGAGALKGATIGTAIAPGIGTAIGAAIGGIGGALVGGLGGKILGGLVGAIKPLGAMFKHGLASVGEKIMNGAKWANEHKDKILAILKPIGQTMLTLLELTSPFFRLFKMLYDKITSLKWFKGGDNNPNTVNNPGESNGLGRNIERLTHKGSTSYTKDKQGNAYLGGHMITSDYGWRTHPTGTGSASDGKKQFHKGIDLAYKKGESIGAFVGGTVTYAGNRNDGYGNTVEILDANGVTHKYHHGDSIPEAIKAAYKNKGQVKAGDVIMKAGATGYANGVHLDYETWQNGKHTDPLQYLAKVAEDKANEAKRKKEEEEKAKQAEREKWEKEHPNLAKIDNAIKGVTNSNSTGFKDVTGMNNYTNEQNCTNTQINRGAN